MSQTSRPSAARVAAALPSLGRVLGGAEVALRKRLAQLEPRQLARLLGTAWDPRRRVFTEPVAERDVLWPSDLTTYFRCPRRMWLERRGGVRVRSLDEAIALAYGVVAHRAYAAHVAEALGLDVEEEVDVEGECCGYRWRGRADLIVASVPVEVKSTHRPGLGHRLQTMVYAALLGTGEAVLVHGGGVEVVRLDEALLGSYADRVWRMLRAPYPPPPPPSRERCDACPVRAECAGLETPYRDWDGYLNSLGVYPKGEGCARCPHRFYCRAFRARTGRYPCEAAQKTLDAFMGGVGEG